MEVEEGGEQGLFQRSQLQRVTVTVEDQGTQEVYQVSTELEREQCARVEKLVEAKRFEVVRVGAGVKVQAGGHEFELQKQAVSTMEKIERVLRLCKKEGNLINRDTTLFVYQHARFLSDHARQLALQQLHMPMAGVRDLYTEVSALAHFEAPGQMRSEDMFSQDLNHRPSAQNFFVTEQPIDPQAFKGLVPDANGCIEVIVFGKGFKAHRICLMKCRPSREIVMRDKKQAFYKTNLDASNLLDLKLYIPKVFV